MGEAYLEGGQLVPAAQWDVMLQQVRQKISSGSKDLEPVARALSSAVAARAPDREVAVLFSGGVDSALITLILKQQQRDPICMAVGFQTPQGQLPPDVLQARDVASFLKVPLRECIFTVEESAPIIRRTVNLLGKEANVTRVGVGSVVVAAAGLAQDCKDLFSGLGSEELFAGYARHLEHPTNEECWNGLHTMYQRDLVRDVTLSQALSIRLHTPFLDPEVIREGMRLPITMKLAQGVNKWAVRRIADQAGLGERAYAKKRAAQYGSGLLKVMGRLAKAAGYKTKQSYLDSLQG